MTVPAMRLDPYVAVINGQMHRIDLFDGRQRDFLMGKVMTISQNQRCCFKNHQYRGVAADWTSLP